MYKKLLLGAVLVILLGFVISNSINLKEVGKLISTFPLWKIVLILLLSSAILLVKSLLFKIICEGSGIKFSYPKSVKIFIASQVFTPLPGGEAGRIILVKEETRSDTSKIHSSIISQAFMELFSSALVLIISSLFFKELFTVSASVTFVLIFLSLFLNNAFLDKILKKLSFFKAIKERREGILETQMVIRRVIFQKNKKKLSDYFYKILVVAVCYNIIGGILIYFISSSFNTNLSLTKSVIVYSCGIVIQWLSAITPGGLGFTEGGLTGVLFLFGLNPSQAFATVLIFRLTTLLYYILLGCIFLIAYYRKIIWSKK